MPASGVELPVESVSDGMPEWMGCDLAAYNIVQEVSSQIVSNCETFGKHLEGVCGRAIERLPHSSGDDSFDCSDACISFISAFGALSHELLELADDLESSVRQPLQGIILSLTEERAGRMNHWKQVKTRFAELQERYRRSRQRSIEARGRLAEGKKNWLGRKKDEGKAADEQHAAMCDLAECEEELRESEASLRKLEEENREMLRELNREKQTVLRSVLAKGMGSLRRLVSVADKAIAQESDAGNSGVAPPSPSDGFAGVMPSRTKKDMSDDGEGQEAGEKPEDATPVPKPKSVIPEPPQEALAEPSDGYHAPSDPSAKYVQGSGAPLDIGRGFDISELTESDEEEDAVSRAAAWTPLKESPVAKAKAQRRSLVFQGNAGACLMGPSTDPRPLSTTRKSAPGKLAFSPSSEHPSISTPVSLNKISVFGEESSTVEAETGPPPQAVSAPPPIAGPPVASIATPVVSPSAHEPKQQFSCPQKSPSTSVSSSPQSKRRVGLVEDSDDDDDDEDDVKARAPKPPLEQAPVRLEVLPLVAENAQKCFERYIQRVPETLLGVAEPSWSKLQERAGEQQLGGHVGKLDIFWICRPGTEPSPETADGIVCFQFVQGFAANFARILHLSVAAVGQCSTGRATWSSMLASAVFETRRFIFETLPVDSLRAVVLTGEDDSGCIYVDRDVEAAYHRCRFRWFQLTQNLRRTKSGIRRKHKVRPSTRFLVLHAPRQEHDPKGPRNSTIGRLPAALLKDSNIASDGAEAQSQAATPDVADAAATPSFSAW
jgi:hypothetical protein